MRDKNAVSQRRVRRRKSPGPVAIRLASSATHLCKLVNPLQSEVHPQRHLSDTVSCVLSGLGALRTPNVDVASICVAGGAKFVWLSALVNVDSKRSLNRSFRAKFLAIPRETASGPGPSMIPTPALRKRSAPAGVGANVAGLKKCALDWF